MITLMTPSVPLFNKLKASIALSILNLWVTNGFKLTFLLATNCMASS